MSSSGDPGPWLQTPVGLSSLAPTIQGQRPRSLLHETSVLRNVSRSNSEDGHPLYLLCLCEVEASPWVESNSTLTGAHSMTSRKHSQDIAGAKSH